MFRYSFEHQDNQAHLDKLTRQAQQDQLYAKTQSCAQATFAQRCLGFVSTALGHFASLSHTNAAPESPASPEIRASIRS